LGCLPACTQGLRELALEVGSNTAAEVQEAETTHGGRAGGKGAKRAGIQGSDAKGGSTGKGARSRR